MEKETTQKAIKPLQASKWLKSQVLIDTEEMVALFDALPPFQLYRAGMLTPDGEGALDQHSFLDTYHDYITALREGRAPNINDCRPIFSVGMSTTDNVLYKLKPKEGMQLLRVCRPLVQLQLHTMTFSNGEFRSMALGKNSIQWGIQFSYPQLFQDPESCQILKVDDTFENTSLFKALQRWIRQHTRPTPFIVGGVHINTPQRLGKKCFDWINNHPDLGEMHVKTD